MTAAERQRRCRANGKGRQRGYRPTRAQAQAYAAELRRLVQEGADPATAAAAASAAAAAAAAAAPRPAPHPAPALPAGGGQIVAN